jgi:hypothetical protein
MRSAFTALAFVPLICHLFALNEISQPYNYWRLPNRTDGDRPVLGLVYLHMRKAGGTEFLSLMKSWMSR